MSNEKLAEQLNMLKEACAKWEKELAIYSKWAIENDGVLSVVEKKEIVDRKVDIQAIKKRILNIEEYKSIKSDYSSVTSGTYDIEHPIYPQNHNLKAEELKSSNIKNIIKAEQITFDALKIINTLSDSTPVFVYDDNINYPSYATFKNDKIILRPSLFLHNSDYNSYNAKISIIMHEYKHYLNDKSGLFPLRLTEKGDIFSIETEFEIEIHPTEEEKIKSRRESEILFESETLLTSEEKAILIENNYQLSIMPYIGKYTYKPSNLALDEISAYSFQIELHEKGVLPIDTEELKIIKERIKFYENSKKLAEVYEKNNNFLPSGFPVK